MNPVCVPFFSHLTDILSMSKIFFIVGDFTIREEMSRSVNKSQGCGAGGATINPVEGLKFKVLCFLIDVQASSGRETHLNT